MSIQVNETVDRVQKIMVNGIEFDAHTIFSEDAIQFHNAELLNYLKSINRIDYLNIFIQNVMSGDFLPIVSAYTNTEIDIMIHGFMFGKEALTIQILQS